MARACALVCTFALCAVLCSGRFVDITQDDEQSFQEQPIKDSLDSSTFRSDLSSNNPDTMVPVIKVTVWSTGMLHRGVWDTVSLAVSNPLAWLSTHMADQSIAIPPSVHHPMTGDLADMLRRISCARMRQAMMDYYTFHQGLNLHNDPQLTQIRLTPFITPQLDVMAQQPAGQVDDDAMSTQSEYEFPLRGESSSKLHIGNDGWDNQVADSWGSQAESSTSHHFEQSSGDAISNSMPDFHQDTLSSAGVQELSSMLHMVSDLLSKPSRQRASDYVQDILRSANSAEPGNTAADASYSDELSGYGDEAQSTLSDELYDTEYAENGENGEQGLKTSDNNEGLHGEVFQAEPYRMNVPQPVDSSEGLQREYFRTEPVRNSVRFEYQQLPEEGADGTFEYTDAGNTYAESNQENGMGPQDPWDQDVQVYYDDGMEYDEEEESNFDWGLFVFTLLSASCVVVWAVAVTQYVRLRAMFCHPYVDYDSDSVLAPLLEKVHAVEVAANHVDPQLQGIDTKTALLKAQYCPPQA